MLKDFKREGLDLPKEKLEKVKSLKKKCAELVLTFESNIAKDNKIITVSREDLSGLDDKFISAIKCTPAGKYKLGCDTPTYFEVMRHCSCAKTRKDLYVLFNNRAYPENKKILDDLIETRDALAGELGFESFAALSYDGQMSKTVDTVENFLIELWEKTRNKVSKELEMFTKDLPFGITLDSKGRFAPWDTAYVKECYKKKYFSLDDREVAQYFPVEQTLNKIFEVYQKFLGLKFNLITPENTWAPDVKCIEVHEAQSDRLRGFIILDLYPRANKYTHACQAGVLPAVIYKNSIHPGVCSIIANFPKASGDTPALLKFNDVSTFFHEFGHAMHFILGVTEITSQSGNSVKTDFVEVPSQMFEEWMYDTEVLNIISGHYKTGQKLPKKIIDTIIAIKKYSAGMFLQAQCELSLLSLEIYKKGAKKDIDKLIRTLNDKYIEYAYDIPQTHFQTSFGHLSNYGACYYSYMWSLVFSIDLFYKIRDQGLLNSKIGLRLIETILSKGSSDEPENLLKNFLGRAPTMDAFIDNFGLNE
jgi:thimet oligopeptidase